MLIGVLAQQPHCRNVTVSRSYNWAVAEVTSQTYGRICQQRKPASVARKRLSRPGLSFYQDVRHVVLGVHEEGEFARVGSLHRLCVKPNRKAGPQAVFRYVEP